MIFLVLSSIDFDTRDFWKCIIFHRSFPKLPVRLPDCAGNKRPNQGQLYLETLYLLNLRDPMTQTMQQALLSGCWGSDMADGSTRAVCSPRVAVTHRAPQVCPPGARCAPTATSGQLLPDTSWHWMEKSDHEAALWKPPSKKSSADGGAEWTQEEQMSMEERVAGLKLTPLTSTATARDCWGLHSSLCSHLQQDIQLLLLNQMGKKGRVMGAQKRKVQLKHSEKIAIKNI